MREEPREYSVAELLDHPGLVLIMTTDGIERRGMELVLGARGREPREADYGGDKTRDFSG
jgi:hypothetical protein